MINLVFIGSIGNCRFNLTRNIFIYYSSVSIVFALLIQKSWVRFLTLPWDFFQWRIIPRYVQTGCFCVSLSFVHVLSSVAVGGGPYTLLTTGEVLLLYPCSYMWSRVTPSQIGSNVGVKMEKKRKNFQQCCISDQSESWNIPIRDTMAM